MPSCSYFKNDPNKKIVINYIECDPPHFHVIKDPRTKTIARIIFDQNQFTLMDYISKKDLDEKDLEILKNWTKIHFSELQNNWLRANSKEELIEIKEVGE